MSRSVLIVGSGLGGLATALRLSDLGWDVTIVEKYNKAGGRLNLLEKDGFVFDMGPSFFSMSYEFKELFKSVNEPVPFVIKELDPLYSVWFEGNNKPYHIYKDLDKLANEFKEIEPEFKKRAEQYLNKAGKLFHDTEHKIIKQNFDGLVSYLVKGLARVPVKHLPMMFRTMWRELEKTFDSEQVKVIFSLVSFFLGSPPFETPAVYSLLNYTELKHDGYYNVEGGMYSIVTSMLPLLEKRGVKIVYNTEIVSVVSNKNGIQSMLDANGKSWDADVFVCNADAAWFRGAILKRSKYTPKKLDKMDWTLAPFTIYLGVEGKMDNLAHHNYFLGNNFSEYSKNIFKTSIAPNKPYYYVNASSKSNPNCAPAGCENLFILCPVPDLRYKKDWSDSEELSNNIIRDLGIKTGFDLENKIISKTVYTPEEWKSMFNLYQGSGLGLSHGLNQIGALRPANFDEVFKNLFYVGASTHPGTGLPIVVIGSKLVTERIMNEY